MSKNGHYHEVCDTSGNVYCPNGRLVAQVPAELLEDFKAAVQDDKHHGVILTSQKKAQPAADQPKPVAP